MERKRKRKGKDKVKSKSARKRGRGKGQEEKEKRGRGNGRGKGKRKAKEKEKRKRERERGRGKGRALYTSSIFNIWHLLTPSHLCIFGHLTTLCVHLTSLRSDISSNLYSFYICYTQSYIFKSFIWQLISSDSHISSHVPRIQIFLHLYIFSHLHILSHRFILSNAITCAHLVICSHTFNVWIFATTEITSKLKDYIRALF